MNPFKNFYFILICFASSLFAMSSQAEEISTSFNHSYIGLNTGYAWENVRYSTNPNCIAAGGFGVFCSTDTSNSILNNFAVANIGAGHLSPTHFIGNIDIGHNWEKSSFVFGSEADFGVFNWASTALAHGFFPYTFLGNQFILMNTASTNWLGTLRGRLGFLMKKKRLFLYASGGAAFTTFHAATSYQDNAIGFGFPGGSGYNSRESTRAGWILGAGSEFLLSPHTSFKIEYFYLNFGSINFTVPLSNTPEYTQTMQPKFNLKTQLVRIGFNYLF